MKIQPVSTGLHLAYRNNAKPRISISHPNFGMSNPNQYESAEARAERQYFENINSVREEKARFDAFNRKIHYAREHGIDPSCLDIRDFYEKPEPIDYDDFEALGELYDDSSDFI